ncbi:phosphoribosyltransferase [Legionella beliardensis]|uniref:Phosphoribosyltransferase n=1 Tax=Legionella beliardensis TaxID=91822 RepID=A0A378I2F7_9GAMM|nr:phosphoribosyltransferase [Legionella beliardensis]STX29377.1 phosphoribosyltransferase [Legionella beliardensis]
MDKYQDRQAAGKVLAKHLKDYANKTNTIVLALPRGGVPVAYEVASALSLPLDVFIVRKLGVPWHKELAMGAIASGGCKFFNQEVIESLEIAQDDIDKVIQKEEKELQRRELLYRNNQPLPNFYNKTIILVDDGIATGATIRAAIKALKNSKPASIIVSVPVAALSTYKEMTRLVQRVVCPLKPVHFYAVGLWYAHFPQTTDAEVTELLRKANENYLANAS